MQRIHYDFSEDDEKLLISDKDIIHQFVKVLRLGLGDKIIFFNSSCFIDFVFEIKEINKKEIILEKVEEIKKNSEIDFELDLYVGLPNKTEKIEYIIQKGTEIGIKNFFFFTGDRSQKLNINENKINRFKKIIIEAVEQSGRNIIPNIVFLPCLDFELLGKGEKIFFDVKAGDRLKSIKLNYDLGINVFIGPEGGFTDKETESFEKHNFKKLSLGTRILRTETAAIAVPFYIIQSK